MGQGLILVRVKAGIEEASDSGALPAGGAAAGRPKSVPVPSTGGEAVKLAG